jgi:polyketide biosynthesis enoyl-CoA hydratase PksH
VIAVVHGAATGGGVGLAAACDLVLAARGATFALTELLFGLLPAVIGPYLAQRVSPARLRLWALGATTLDATVALQAGLVDGVADEPGLARETAAWVRRLARPPAEAVSLWKRQMATAAAAAANCAVWATNGRLRDPAVLASIRRFVEEGEAPWRR